MKISITNAKTYNLLQFRLESQRRWHLLHMLDFCPPTRPYRRVRAYVMYSCMIHSINAKMLPEIYVFRFTTCFVIVMKLL